MNELAELVEFLPFLIPLLLMQYGLIGYSLYHIFTHNTYKRGNRVLWVILTLCINFIGPVLYLIIGKEDE